MASTADIQVSANRGRTTQELHREALSDRERGRQGGREGERRRNKGFSLKPDQPALVSHITPLLSLRHTHTQICHRFGGG